MLQESFKNVKYTCLIPRFWRIKSDPENKVRWWQLVLFVIILLSHIGAWAVKQEIHRD